MVNGGRTADELPRAQWRPELRTAVTTLPLIGACALRRKTAVFGVAVALVVAMGACGGSDDDKKTTTTGLPGSTSTTDSTATTATTISTATTVAGSSGTGATTASTAPGTPGTPGPTSPTVKPSPSVTVALYLQKGEIPPGQTQPLEAPAWRATGVGWDPGSVGLIVKRTDGPSVTLNVGANADADGRFEQTFVVLEVEPGTYAAIATQGDKRAEGSFILS